MKETILQAANLPANHPYTVLAVDFDGAIYAYVDEPVKSFSCWITSDTTRPGYYVGQLPEVVPLWDTIVITL